MRVVVGILLFVSTAGATHYVMSFAQTVMHRALGHRPIGGKFFRNHLKFHHTYYCANQLVLRTYRGDEGNNTPFFFIPVCLVGASALVYIAVVSLYRAGDRMRGVILHARLSR